MSYTLNRTAVVGIGQTEFSKNSGRSELQLAVEASKSALDDAGLSPADIDGTVTFIEDTNAETDVLRHLGVRELRWTARSTGGGGGASATVQLAATAVASGAANAVLIYRAFNERSGQRFGQPIGGYAAGPPQQDIHFSFGLNTPAKIYALWYQPYMSKYGVTNEDLADYVVTARRHAATNPRAWFYQKPITVADHQNSRWIVEPVLRLLDCCQESDGGVALIVTSAERAKDLRQPGVRVVGAAQGYLNDTQVLFNYYRKDLADLDDIPALSAQLWKQTGLSAKDIDVAMIYENFSPVVFIALEGFGFCGRGEAKSFIKDGHIGLEGSIPVNTNGGLLGEAYIHGMNNVLEGVRQIRGTAANQIDNAEHALVGTNRSAVIFGRM
jgi:acetyl-CoA acetyltransferase